MVAGTSIMIKNFTFLFALSVFYVLIVHEGVARTDRLSLPEMVQKYMTTSAATAGPPQIVKSYIRLNDKGLVRDTVQYATREYTVSFTRNVQLENSQSIPDNEFSASQIYYGEAHFSNYDIKTGRINSRNFIIEKHSGWIHIYRAKAQPVRKNGYSFWQKSSLITRKKTLEESLRFLRQAR